MTLVATLATARYLTQARTVKQCWLPALQTLVRMLVFVKRHLILRVSPACVLLAGKVSDVQLTLMSAPPSRV